MMVVIQTGSWPGWPGGVHIELTEGAAAAVLTAARDYQRETGRDLKGDYAALPCGGLRLPEWVTEMQWAFDHRHSTGADLVRANALYTKYNMDRSSNARPSMGTHPTGNCIDFSNNGFLAWLKSSGRAARYGLRFTLTALHDLRHAQYFPGTETVALDVTALDNNTLKEVTAMYVRRVSNKVVALFNGTGEHDFTSLADYSTHRSVLNTYNAQAVNAGDQQFVPPEDPGQVIGLDETGWASVVAMYGAHTVAGGGTPADYYSDSDAARDLKATVESIAATQKAITDAIAAIKFPTKGTVELA